MNVGRALLVAAVVASCGDSKAASSCGSSIYLGSAWLDTGGVVVLGAGYYAGDWYDPGDTWDGSDVPGDDTSTPVGDDTSSGDGTDTSGGGDDSTGGDTSGGGDDSTDSLGVRPLSAQPGATDAHGCYECVVVCATVASPGSASEERVARGFSVYGRQQACAHAVGALERWAHYDIGAKLASCEDVEDAVHSPATPGVATPSSVKGAVPAGSYQRRATAIPAEPGPLGAVK
jgi:hypothetical protein